MPGWARACIRMRCQTLLSWLAARALMLHLRNRFDETIGMTVLQLDVRHRCGCITVQAGPARMAYSLLTNVCV